MACWWSRSQRDSGLGALVPAKSVRSYDLAMAQRLRVLVGGKDDEQVSGAAIRTLNDDADQCAETVLLGLDPNRSFRCSSSFRLACHRHTTRLRQSLSVSITFLTIHFKGPPILATTETRRSTK